MSHSSGPWQIHDKALQFGDCTLGTQIWGQCRIAFTERQNVGAEEEAANARLIAAAPELLEALIYVRDHICDPERGLREIYPAFGLDAGNAVRLVKSAIAKAEGLS